MPADFSPIAMEVAAMVKLIPIELAADLIEQDARTVASGISETAVGTVVAKNSRATTGSTTNRHARSCPTSG